MQNTVNRDSTVKKITNITIANDVFESDVDNFYLQPNSEKNGGSVNCGVPNVSNIIEIDKHINNVYIILNV